MIPLRFEVQTFTVCQGWTNCWMVDDEPGAFATSGEAWAAIAEIDEIAWIDIDDPECWPQETDCWVIPMPGRGAQ